jgi:predicted DNA-binding transcriptional regulator AlpA
LSEANIIPAEIRGWHGAAAFAGKSVSQLKRDAASGLFPLPHSKGARSIFWYVDELEAWRARLPRCVYANKQNPTAKEIAAA